MANLIFARMDRASTIAAVWLALAVQGMSYGQSPVQTEGEIYWTGFERGIHRSSLDGTNIEQLVIPEWSYPGDIALDLSESKMYWTDRRVSGGIYRSGLDGTNVELILPSWGFESSKWLDPPLGDISIDRGEGRVLDPVWLLNYGSGTLDIALDKVRNKMYWSEMFNHGDYTTGGLFRMNLEGGTSEYVWEHFPEALALDLIRDKIYWAAFNGIHRADLNGENLENDLISQGSSSIGDLALDIERGKMYWTAWRTVQRADLDGENIEEVLALPEGHPEKIALDVKRGMIYWTNPVTMTIHRADLDGQNAHHLFDLEKDVKRLYLGLRTGIALDVEKEKVYWTDSGPGKIKRGDFNGENLEILFDPVVREPHDIVLYMGKMYWTDVIKGTIQRADLNGENLEVLISGLNRPEGIALLEGNKIYWTEGGPGEFLGEEESETGKIQSADLNGTNVKGIVTGLRHPGGIALDAVRGKVYWADSKNGGSNIIQRADLDGSNGEAVPGLADLEGGFIGYRQGVDARVTALYVLHDKIYWAEAKAIKRADLDGSNVEGLSILPEDRYVYHTAFALDPVGFKAYWSTLVEDQYGEVWAEEIFRSNLDGSNEEKIGNAPSGSWGNIALDISVPTAVSMQNTSPAVPVTSSLEPNAPNPFNSTTRIPYHLATSGPVRLEIYNTLGQRVRTLVDEVQPAGFYQARWNARDEEGSAVSAGVYLTRLHYTGGVQTRRLLFLK